MSSFFRKNWFGILSVVASATIIIYFMVSSGGLANLWQMLLGVQKRWIIFACASVLISWSLDTVTLHMIISCVRGGRQSILSSIKFTVIGMLYCALTPFAVGGQPMQIAQMSASGIPSGSAVSIISIKSVVYQTGIIVYSIVAIISCFSFFVVGVPYFVLFSILGLAANLLFIGVILLMCINVRLPEKLARYWTTKLAKWRILKHPEIAFNSVQKQIFIFHDSFSIIRRSIFTVVRVLLITFLQLTCLYLVPYFICRGFSASSNSLFYMISANAIITMITAFIPLPGGSGAAEGSFHMFFSLFLSDVVIFPALFLWRVLTYYSIILLGGIMSAGDILVKPEEKAST